MWLHRRRVFRIDAEPKFSQFIAAERGIAVRIRTERRRSQNFWTDLSHTL
jgi:hypothetical protein